jgi:DNA-binding CsgD family transcriptional regulator
MTDLDPAIPDKFIAMGGTDPKINPRVRAGMTAPTLKVLAENDFISPDEYRRDPHYNEFAIPHGFAYSCLSTLDRTPGMLTGLAVMRNERQGHISEPERAVFASLAPHVRAAVRTQAALEGNGAALLAGAMEALAMPAFVCDRTGTVRKLTSAAEQLAAANRGLLLKEKRLRAASASDSKELDDAIGAAARGRLRPGAPLMRTVIVHGADLGSVPIVLDVISLPTQATDFSFMPHVLVIARGSNTTYERKAAVLQAAFDMTSAESDIALQLCSGKTAETIAAARKVAVGTVRAQIKALLAKAGVKRQLELVARLNQL